jgi:hypothetical protein
MELHNHLSTDWGFDRAADLSPPDLQRQAALSTGAARRFRYEAASNAFAAAVKIAHRSSFKPFSNRQQTIM